MKKLLFILLLFFVIRLANAQIELNYFTVSSLRNKVELNWEIERGSFCFGITIHRSTDGINFSPIGFIDGICGSTTEAQQFSYTDDSPLNYRLNYYRLEFQSSSYSEIKVVEHSFVEDGFYVEHPILANSFLHFSEASGELSVYTTNGTLVSQTSISSEKHSIRDFLTEGIYGPLVFVYRKMNNTFIAKKLIVIF